MSKAKQAPYVLFSGEDLRVIFQEYPGVEAALDEPKPQYLRPEKRGRVHYSICGDLPTAEALVFASNLTLAANLAEAWEKGEETRETVLEKYGKVGE